MKTKFIPTSWTRSALLFALGAGLIALNVNLRAQDKERLEELRLQAKRLQEQAADKKAAGAHEDAERLAEQAERLMREAQGLKQRIVERERPEQAEFKEHAERRERLQAKIKGAGASAKRVITTVPDGIIDLKTSILPDRVPSELPIETGLAEYFALIRKENQPATPAPKAVA